MVVCGAMRRLVRGGRLYGAVGICTLEKERLGRVRLPVRVTLEVEGSRVRLRMVVRVELVILDVVMCSGRMSVAVRVSAMRLLA